jgi:hypothetical protein
MMRTTLTHASVLEQGPQALPGEVLTRRAVTVITRIIFSFRVSRGCDLRRRVVDVVVDALAAS